MKWIRNNAGLVATLLAIVGVILGWASGIFGWAVATEAKPVIKEEIRIHELEVEPRLQTIENIGQHNKEEIGQIQKKLDDSAIIQQQILDEVTRND